MDRERTAAALGGIAAVADAAKRDPTRFLEFVLLPEDELKFSDAEKAAAAAKRPPLNTLVAPPHQRLLLDFALAHEVSVIMLPSDHAKTSTMVGLGLYLMQDPTLRGAIVSAEYDKAAKVLNGIRGYIEQSQRFRMVAPEVRPSTRDGDPWTQSAITVERPYGMRDPTLTSYGMTGGIIGSRLDFVVVDDVLDEENTATQERRQSTISWFYSSVLSRLSKEGRGHMVVCNTAWHPEDLLHEMRGRGFPTLRMDVYGGVWIYNTRFGCEGHPGADQLRDAVPADGPEYEPGMLRLTGLDQEPPERRSLWPDRYDLAKVEGTLRKNLRFNQLYMNLCRDEETSLCKQEYVDACLKKAREIGHHRFESTYNGPGYVFTGVDLAFREHDRADYTAFFTFVVLPDGLRKVLDVEYGRWSAAAVVKKIQQRTVRYPTGIVVVESNGAQSVVRDWALQQNVSLPVVPYNTDARKNSVEYGVPSLFAEMSNAAWAFPNVDGQVHPHMQKFVDGCLYYEPTKHCDDGLMAVFFAREKAREWGLPATGDSTAGSSVMHR